MITVISKKVLTALLCVSLLFSCLFGFASVSFGLSANGFEYSVSGNNATVTAYNGTEDELTVPETVDGYNVTGISVKAFNDCTSLQKINIHKGVNLISSYAFDGCTSLKAINIDSENEKYSSADGVLFNKSQTYLYRYPEGKTETEYVIPDTVSFIGSYAFANAENLKELTVPSSVSGFGDGFAADCKSLISINVTEGNSYFYSSEGVLFDRDKTAILYYPAANPQAYYSIPDTVISIGRAVFADCASLEKVDIPESVNSIDEYAFYNCSSLKEINIPASVNEIGKLAFYGCRSAQSIVLTDGLKKICANAFEECENIKSVDIPDSVTVIEGSAFYKCKSLENIRISESVDKIGFRTFACCEALREIDIPNSVKRIESKAFESCKLLEKVMLSDSVTEIDEKAFYNCTAMKSVTLEKNIGKIGRLAFGFCENGEETFKTEGFTVYGYKDSAAEQYAADNGFKFVCLDEIQPPVISFPDVKESNWFYTAVEYCATKGYITGYHNGFFGPADNLKRQDFIIILARIAGANLEDYVGKPSKLKDVDKNAYYAAAVNWSVKEGIISGYQNGNFGVGDSITREQIATVLYRYTGAHEIENTELILERFSDRSRISGFAKDAFAWAVENKIINGMADGRAAPTEFASRAQIAVIIMNTDSQGMFKAD